MTKKLGPWRVEPVCRLEETKSKQGFQIMDGDDVVVEMFEGNGYSKLRMQKILRLMAASLELVAALEQAEAEILRLHRLHKPMFEGKVGEPDMSVARKIRKALRRTRSDA